MDVQDKFSIASINLKEPQIRILKFLITSYLQDDFSFTQQKKATVHIVALPSENVAKKINKYKQQYPDSYFIVFSDDHVSIPNVSAVNFPISPKKLLDALNTTLENIKRSAATKNKTYPKNRMKKKTDLKPHDIKKKECKKESKNENKTIKKQNDIYSDLDDHIKNTPSPLLNKQVVLQPSEIRPFEKNKSVDHDKIENKNSTKDKFIDIKKEKLPFLLNRPDVDMDNISLMSKISYSCTDYLQGGLKNLINSKEINRITTSYCSITYNEKNHTIHVNVNNRTLQNIATLTALTMTYSMVDSKPLLNNKKEQWEDADAVLWKLSIWASRGRLPSVFNDLDRQFTLRYWPNLTRFMMTPHAMEISALWLDKPINLRQSLTFLNIPQRYVFSFYSAAVALDLLSFEEMIKVKTQPTPKKRLVKESIDTSSESSSKNKGVFSKLLRFFKPNNIENI